MEVMVESPSRSPRASGMDNFELRGTMIPPYLSAPSSPKRFGEFYKEFYDELGYLSNTRESGSSIQLEAATNEEDDGYGDGDFAFFVSGESETGSRSAEELFHGGKIKAFKLQGEGEECFASHHKSSEGKKKKKNVVEGGDHFGFETEQVRGRDRDRSPASSSSVLSSSSSGRRRGTRSHSPYRNISRHTWERQQQQQPPTNKEDSTLTTPTTTSNSRAITSSSSSSKGPGSSRRWSLKDLLLFRSASEGRGSSKDPYKKYGLVYKKTEELKASSFRSPDSSSTRSRRKGPVSAHELHYNMKKAESEDLKKKTYLPYKQGILGRLAGFGL